MQKGLLNSQAPQHFILKENLKRINPENQTERYKLKFKKLPTDHAEVKVSSRFKNFEKLIKRNENNRKVVGVIQRAKDKIGELTELKANLQSFKDSRWVKIMKEQFQSHHQHEHAGGIDIREEDSSLSEDDDIKVGDMIGGVPIAGFHSVTFDESKRGRLHLNGHHMREMSLIPPAPEIISNRLF